MNHETLANTIRSRFVSDVVADSGLAVAYDNAPFTPPDTRWVRFSVLTGDSFQASIGASKRFRTAGVAIAQVFVPLNTGDKDALVLCDSIKDAFRAKSINGVTFRTPSVHRVGRTDNWYQINVTCPFYSDDIEGA